MEQLNWCCERMATKNLIQKIDENEASRRHVGKENFLKNYAPNEVKRSALGELGNRVFNRAEKVASKKEDDTQKPTFKHVKARVDCWKAPKTTSVNVDTASKKIVTVKTEPSVEHRVKVYVQKNPQTKPATKLVRSNSTNSTSSNGEPRKVLTRQAARDERKSVATKKSQELIKIPENDKIIFSDLQAFKIDEDVVSHSQKLLYHIEDIDANDEDPQLVSEYAVDIYNYLYDLEAAQSIKKHFLEHHFEITAKMRSVLIDWLNEVHFQFQLQSETFYMCIGLIDRYLECARLTKRKQLQLVGCTALFIASKYEDMFPPNISDFVYITDHTYTERQICEMEKTICKALDFQLGRPLPIHFLRRYSKAANVNGLHHLMSKYFLELITVEYSMAHYKPSEVAAASLLLTLHLFVRRTTYNKELWSTQIQHYSSYSLEHLKPIAQQIARIAKDAPNAKYKAVYNKYTSSKFEKITTRPELNGSIIEKLMQD